MRPTNVLAAGLVLVSVFLLGGWAFRQDKGMEGGGMPPMPKPTPHHEKIKSGVGTWEGVIRMTGLDGKPQESKCTETVRMLGEFWALAEFEGEMMGMPFKGFGINGYDPDKKKHVGAWVDSMSSEMLLVEGECSKDCQKQTLSAMGKDQATGKPVRFKMLAEHQDADHRTFEMEPEGQPGHEMKITYTRKK